MSQQDWLAGLADLERLRQELERMLRDGEELLSVWEQEDQQIKRRKS